MTRICSPLRYPGGKNKLSKFVAEICVRNNINGCYVEPYAGGASVALYLLMEGFVSNIVINDIDRSIFAFWHSVLKNTNKLCKLIEQKEVTIETWKQCKEIQKNKKNARLLDLGFSTFFLNRTNISGIIDAGVIGGISQTGKYKIDCRYNKTGLIKRIKDIAKLKKHIELFKIDALELISIIQKRAKKDSTIFYFDPPYYLKGPSLYLNSYTHQNHVTVGKKIMDIKNIHWIVSYDNVPEIKRIYSKANMAEYVLSYTAMGIKKGNEVLFYSQGLKIPQLNTV